MAKRISVIRAKISRLSLTLPFLLILITVLSILLHDLRGGTLLESSSYNSYTRQALAWRQGQMYLPENVPWLELAVYEGRYWVSFPPVPSLFMLPLTFVFGINTPDNLVMLALVLLSVTAVYLTLRKRGYGKNASAFISTGVVLGCNLFNLSMEGAVWYMAQSFAFCLCMFSILALLKRRFGLALALVALALGCRPFSVLLVLPIAYLYFAERLKDRSVRPLKRAQNLVKTLLPALIIGLALMLYNYVRFKNPFEFGHSYLPEFNRGELQFSTSFIGRNLKGLMQLVGFDGEARLTYTIFNGFCPLLANPIFILLFIEIGICFFRREWSPMKLITLSALILNFFFLLCHRTFGGFQFGARYTVDLIPCTLIFFLLLPKRKLTPWRRFILCFGIIFNLYGALAVSL